MWGIQSRKGRINMLSTSCGLQPYNVKLFFDDLKTLLQKSCTKACRFMNLGFSSSNLG